MVASDRRAALPKKLRFHAARSVQFRDLCRERISVTLLLLKG
jgi:hypothetical protein